MNFIRNLLLLSIAFPSFAAAEVIPEGSGIIFGNDHAFSLTAPKGWVLDNSSAAKSGLHAVFYPEGSTWKDSKVVAYARSRPIDEKVKTVQDSVDSVLADFHAKGHTNYKGTKDSELKMESGNPGIVYKFTGDNWGNFEAVCYFKEKKTINYVVLSSRDKEAFDQAWERFVALSKSYVFISDSIDHRDGDKGED